MSNWETCKAEIENLPGNYAHQMVKYAEYDRSYRVGRFMKHEIEMGLVEGFPVQLIVYDGKDGKAWYAAFNNQERACYQRALI